MIAVEAPSPAHWVRGLATVVRTGGSNGGAGENDFSLHNADGALYDNCDEGKKSEPLVHCHSATSYAQPGAAAAAGLQHRQRRRASIGNVFHRSASPPPPPAGPQECNAAEGRGPRSRQGRRSTMDTVPSYGTHVYTSAYRTPRDHDAEASDDEGSEHNTKLKRDRSVSGLEHFEHILALEEEEEVEQKEPKRSLADNIRDNFLSRSRSDSDASNEEDPAADNSSQQDSACNTSAATDPVASRWPRRRVSNEDVRDVILNDDISWHNIRVEIRRMRLVTSLGVAQVCQSYVSSERGEAARQRIIKRRSMDHAANNSNSSNGSSNESVGQATAATAETQEQGNGRMRRRLSLF